MARKNKPGAGRKLFDGKDYNAVLLKLMQAWSVGASDQEASAHAEISDSALCQFLKAHPEISKHKEQLKEKPILNARVTLAKAIQKGDGSLAIKYLERVRKREFSTLQEVSGLDGRPLQTSVVQVYIPHNGRDPLPEQKEKPKKKKAK
jgi:hypothetical protein